MAKIEITKTELVWPGKYNEDGTLKKVPHISLPFQVIERVNESRATRKANKGGVQGTLFDGARVRKATPSRRAGGISSSGATTCW
jgi:adenine-specific DNA-methyltransferase